MEDSYGAVFVCICECYHACRLSSAVILSSTGAVMSRRRDMTRMVLARAPMERNDIFMEDSYGAELLCVFGCCYVHRVSSAVIVSPPGAVMSSGPRHDGQKGPRARAYGMHRHFHGG